MLQWSERLLVNLQHQVQYDYNVTAQKANSTSYAYGLTLAWNSIQTHVRPLFLSHDSLTSDCHFNARSVSWVLLLAVKYKKLSYRRDSTRCANDHSRSFKVIRCCANQRGTYDFLLALTSNLTSIFNRSWDITLSLHICTPSLFQVELEKDGWEWMGMLWC